MISGEILSVFIATAIMIGIVLWPKLHHKHEPIEDLEVKFKENIGMTPCIDTVINGTKVRLLVDTGATLCGFKTELVDKWGGNSKPHFCSTAHGMVMIRFVTNRLSILGKEIEQYCALDQTPPQCDGIIGANLLHQYASMQINYLSHKIIFRREND